MDERIRAAWQQVVASDGTDITSVRRLLRELERSRENVDNLGGTEIWVGIYTHRHGTDVAIYQTSEDAYNAIMTIIYENWVSEGINDPIPSNYLDAIELYQERTQEHFEIEQRTISPSPISAPNIPEELLDSTDEFFISYIGTALWAETDPNSGAPLDRSHTIYDIAPETLTRMREDCNRFQRENITILRDLRNQGLTQDRTGHYFWLTRNRHGAGFMDLPPWPGINTLIESAHSFGEINLYVGDDGLIYSA